jgi:hypothetical protein
MVTTELVVGAMNAMADYELACGAAGVNFEDLDQHQDNVEELKCAADVEVNPPVDGPQDIEQRADDDDHEPMPDIVSDSDSDDEDGENVTPFYEDDRYDVDGAGDESDQGQMDAGEEEIEPVVRRSARIIAGTRKPQRFHAYHTSVKKGLKEHGVDAYDAIVAELKQLLKDKRAMTPVHRGDLSSRQLKKVIRSIMFLKTKYDGIGRFEKIKARLVANGAMQDRQLYPDTSPPTAMLQSVMMVLAVSAFEDRKVGAIDIGGAYLNAERDPTGEEVIMELEPMLVSILAKVAPEIKPFTDRSGKLLVKLDKAMYGTLDAAKIWCDKLTGALRDMGFEHNDVDPCVMNKMFDGNQCTLVVYVDDLLITCKRGDVLTTVTEELKSRFGDVKFSQEEDISYLGMHIKVKDGAATVSMEAYVRGVLSEYPVTGVVTTPATADLFTQISGDKQLDRKQAKLFHTIVAKLLYVAKRSRVDILLAVAALCTRVKEPTETDWAKLQRVLKYLNGTADQVLVIRPTDLELDGYIDASFGCHDDGKSHTGMVVTIGGATVMCMSSKQKIVTKDSTEAELVGLSDKVMNVLQCDEFMRAQGHNIGTPVLLQDNTSTITLVTKGGGKYRSKYMKVRQEFVKERVDAGDAFVQYLPTKLMLADALSKPLQGELSRVMTRSIVGATPARHRGALKESPSESEA